MDELIKSFTSKFSTLSPALTWLFMLTVMFLYTFKSTITQKIKEIKLSVLLTPWFVFKEKKTIPTITQKRYHELNAHDLFNVIEDVKRDLKHHVFAGDPNKTAIFQDFIKLMLEEIRKSLKKLIIEVAVMNKDGEDAPRDELKHHIMKVLGLLVENYCAKAKHLLIEKGLKGDDAEYVVNLFEEWRGETRKSINDRVNAIFASEFYDNNFSRTLAVYELISVSVSLIPKDGIRSFESMNGHFKRIEYKR